MSIVAYFKTEFIKLRFLFLLAVIEKKRIFGDKSI